MIVQFIKFCLVGGSGVFVDFGITWFFKEICHINKYIANSIGFVCAATSNYLLNRIWTFESHAIRTVYRHIGHRAAHQQRRHIPFQ